MYNSDGAGQDIRIRAPRLDIVSGVPKKFHSSSFDNYDANQDIVDVVQKFFEQPFNLLIHGPPGVGKTHLAVAMFKVAAYQYQSIGGSAPLFARWETLIESYKNGFSDRTASYILNEYLKSTILFMDDINADLTQTERNVLSQIIINRYDQSSYFVITSNENMPTWMNILKHREASRFSSSLVTLSITGRDRRDD